MKKKLLVVLGAVVVVIGAGLFFITDGLSEGARIPLSGIDLSAIPDGHYTGTYDFKRWTNTVTVSISDHQIISIDLNKDVAVAGATNCADEVFSRVIEAQSTEVDAVSGATVTSKAYLKAIENAVNP